MASFLRMGSRKHSRSKRTFLQSWGLGRLGVWLRVWAFPGRVAWEQGTEPRGAGAHAGRLPRPRGKGRGWSLEGFRTGSVTLGKSFPLAELSSLGVQGNGL